MILQRVFFVGIFFMNSTLCAQDVIPATFKWRVQNSVYPYGSSGHVFLSSGEALSDFCSLARAHPGYNRSTYWYNSFITTCPSSGLKNKFDTLGAENYFSSYTTRYEYITIPPREAEESERAVRLDRWAFCDNPSFPVSYFEIENGQYSRAECGPQYVAILPEESPPSHCSVGNPIDPTTGVKTQREHDVETHILSGISYDRVYSNNNKATGGIWYNTYNRSLSVFPDQYTTAIREKGTLQSSKSAACYSGWLAIKPRLSDNWAQGTSSRWSENKQACEITQSGRVVKHLLILPEPANLRLVIPGYVQLVREDGAILYFQKIAADTFTSINGASGILKKVTSEIPRWELKTENNDVELYSSIGKLLSITASNGLKQELFYDETSGLLTRVSDTTGRELLFTYNDNQLASVTVDGNKTTSYNYNSEGLITKVTRPDNTERIYHYEDSRFPTALTGITDERGVRYATWAYDEQGRAISSEHAGGAEKTMLTFNDNMSTTVTNALNKKTTYFYTHVAGTLRINKVEGQPTENCAGANQNYTYTPEGWLESKTDWKGVKTTYTYNTLGQETSRTEAFGTPDARTITTEWHPSLYLKTKIIEPERETVYNYDGNGRLLNQSTHSITVQ